MLRVRDDGILEIIPLNKLYDEVSRIFEEKFRDWKEENHEASKFLIRMVK